MKKCYSFFIALSLVSLVQAQSVAIGTTTPVPSAQLDVTSTSKGFLPPRMTYTQRDAIPNPVPGLVIWCSDCDELQVYNGTIWKNISGTAASNPGFPSVTICNNIWMIKNLNVSTYRNGDTIPQVTDQAKWIGLTTGAWCWYNNDSATYAATYGKLYNWYAVNDPRELAPLGWHIPSDLEWTALSNCLGGDHEAGGKMKEIGTSHWILTNLGTNSSGFTGLPGGYRHSDGAFFYTGEVGRWWSTTEKNASTAWADALINVSSNVNKYTPPKVSGLSVRCVRD